MVAYITVEVNFCEDVTSTVLDVVIECCADFAGGAHDGDELSSSGFIPRDRARIAEKHRPMFLSRLPTPPFAPSGALKASFAQQQTRATYDRGSTFRSKHFLLKGLPS